MIKTRRNSISRAPQGEIDFAHDKPHEMTVVQENDSGVRPCEQENSAAGTVALNDSLCGLRNRGENRPEELLSRFADEDLVGPERPGLGKRVIDAFHEAIPGMGLRAKA